jgi:UPF0716 protein FxsA
MRFPVISLLVLALPLMEIAGFVLVGSQIGVLPTIGLVILAAVAGAVLLRVQGFGAMQRIRSEMEAGRDPSREVAHGAMILVAAILLLIPGFITDIVGILLFLPPIRDLGWRFLRGRLRFAGGFSGASSGFRRPASGRTLDLDADEYSKQPGDDRDRPGIGRD